MGTALPNAWHKTVSASTAESFSPEDCYADGVGPERVLCVDDNVEALTLRLGMIEQAQEEILYSTFALWDDESGRDVMSALMAAADRGVRVRFVTDALNWTLHLENSPYANAFASCPNVEVRVYNPLDVLRPWTMQMRMHDKYIVVDDSLYLLGGRNTNDLFLGEDTTGGQSIDRELLVYEAEPSENASLSQLRSYFETIWSLPECVAKTPAVSEKCRAAAEELRARYTGLREDSPGDFAPVDWEARTLPTNRITLLSNPPQAVNREPVLWYQLKALMADGDDVLLQTPYIICSGDMYDSLAEIGSSVKSFGILTNAVENGANIFGCSDYLNNRGKILDTGAAIYEFAGGNSIHRKCILIDGRMSIVGSYNLDMRSTYLDTELMLAVDSEALAGQLREKTEAELSMSRLVSPDGSVTYGEQYELQAYPASKKILYNILRVVILPIRHLL